MSMNLAAKGQANLERQMSNSPAPSGKKPGKKGKGKKAPPFQKKYNTATNSFDRTPVAPQAGQFDNSGD